MVESSVGNKIEVELHKIAIESVRDSENDEITWWTLGKVSKEKRNYTGNIYISDNYSSLNCAELYIESLEIGLVVRNKLS